MEFFLRSLKGKLALNIFLLAIIPLLVLSAFSYQRSYRSALQDQAEDLEALTHSRGVQIETYLELRRQQARQIAAKEEIRRYLTGETALAGTVKAYFYEVIAKIGGISCICLLDPAGQVVLSSHLEREGQPTRNLELLGAAARDTVVGNILHKNNGEDIFSILTPVTSYDGRIQGFLEIYWLVRDLEAVMLEQRGLGSGGVAYLATRQGELLSRKVPALPPGRSGSLLASLPLREISGGSTDFHGEYNGISDQRVIGTAVPIKGTDWILTAEVLRSEVLHEAAFVAGTTLWISLAAALMILVAGSLIAARITAPLRELQSVADHMARGNLQQRVPVRSADEVGLLASSFNSMAARLTELYHDLEEKVEQRTDQLKDTVATLEDERSRLRRRDFLNRLHSEVLASLSSALNQDKLLPSLLQILCPSLIQSAAVYIYDESAGLLKPVASSGHALGSLRAYAPGEGFPGQAYLERRSIHVSQASHEGLIRLGTGLRDTVAECVTVLPITFADTVYGVMVAAALDPLPEDALDCLANISIELGATLRNIQQYQAVHRLAEVLRAKSEELELANQELAQANRVKLEFLAVMSHELNTPLNSIIEFSTLLSEGEAGGLNQYQGDYVRNIKDSGAHLLSLMNDLLDLSKIEAGRLSLQLSLFHLEDVLWQAFALVKGQAARCEIGITIRVEEGVSSVRADVLRVRQIVVNLLTNAIKFSHTGGNILVTAKPYGGGKTGPEAVAGTRAEAETRAAAGVEPVPGGRRGEWVAVSVEDQGVGIPLVTKAGIFEPFNRTKPVAPCCNTEGSGLGLALARSFVELHGGRIWAESIEGRGSTFTFILPCGDAEHWVDAGYAASVNAVDDGGTWMAEKEAAPSRLPVD
ncbi:MAG: HAMP domain-containing protein [Firmicutes bacterium]|nr:HAMP domain-containing protein [Bacillota bacterium]